MNETSKIIFWTFIISELTILSCQKSDYLDSESKPPEFIQLIDDRPLILNESYCLERFTVKTISNSVLGEHNRSLYYFKIMWDSKALMTSIKVESDSLNDSYCEAENKHYYYRKPLNQSVHVFPDEVHEGIRFLPIKLDCKYIITPELEGVCRAIKLRYLTPVCVGDTCTCRNVNITGPNLEGKLENGGVDVFWSFPDDFKFNASSIVISIYTEDGINTEKLVKKKLEINFDSKNSVRHKQHFPINVTTETLYRIQGYFENRIHCRGNSSFLLLRHLEKLENSNYEMHTVIIYTMAFAFLLFFILLGLFYVWKKKMRRICVKLFPSESAEPGDIRYPLKAVKLPPFVENTIYMDFSVFPDHYLKSSVFSKELLQSPIKKDPYQFDYRDLVKRKEIASGNFGIVYLAYSSISVRGCNEFAIKQIKDKASAEDFMEEIKMFKLVGDHPNVVKMFGYCSEPLTIIMEYVPFNLLTYLKNLRAEFERKKSEVGSSISYAELSHSRSSSMSLSDNYISQNEVECLPLNNDYKCRELEYVLDNRELEIFGLQIAKGMAYLESRNIVHRDLAARNVLMDKEKVLKISDFGMSKTGIYINKSSKKFPLRWMSPEALISRVYSNKSDVWSFGVVLWEIGTLGAFPYPNLQNEEVISLLEKGGHLDKPQNVTTQLYSVMVDCWARLPEDRPTFKDLVDKIESFCQKSNGYVEFENLESNYVFPPMEEDIEGKRGVDSRGNC